MRQVILIALAAASTMGAQTTRPPRPLGTWDIEYQRTIIRPHAEPVHATERARLTLRAVGDSIQGDLVVGDSAGGERSVLRGTGSASAWTLYAEAPAGRGMAIFFAAVDAAMDWLRETVHGFRPTEIRLDLVVKGDSLTGTRTVTGGFSGARTAAVRGRRTGPKVPVPNT
jgi:hypothetical protein